MEKKLQSSTFALLSTLTSIIACYGSMALIGLMAALGLAFNLNTRMLAGVISLFAVLAAAIVVLNGLRKRNLGPALLALVGATIILWVMWGRYNWMLELAAFLALLAATCWDWRQRRGR